MVGQTLYQETQGRIKKLGGRVLPEEDLDTVQARDLVSGPGLPDNPLGRVEKGSQIGNTPLHFQNGKAFSGRVRVPTGTGTDEVPDGRATDHCTKSRGEIRGDPNIRTRKKIVVYRETGRLLEETGDTEDRARI